MCRITECADTLYNEYAVNRNANAHETDELILTNVNGSFSTVETYDISCEYRECIQSLMTLGDEAVRKVAKQIAEVILYEYNPNETNINHNKLYNKMRYLCYKQVGKHTR